MAYTYNISNSNSAANEDSFFATQLPSPDILHNHPSTKSFKISKSFLKTPKDDTVKHLDTSQNIYNNRNGDINSRNASESMPYSPVMINHNQGGHGSPTNHVTSPQAEYSDESYYSDSFISESPDLSKKKVTDDQTKVTSFNCGILEQEAVWMQIGQQQQYSNAMDDGKIPKIWSRIFRKNPKWHQNFTMPFTAKTKRSKRWDAKRNDVAQTQRNIIKESNTTQRVHSAQRLKYHDMRNRIESMKTEMKNVIDENKLLKRLQRKQEKALVEFNSQESDLPLLLQRHNNEVITLREHLRKTREKQTYTERTLRALQLEMHNRQKKLVRYKELAENKDMPERDHLYQKVTFAENECHVKQRKIDELERYIENLNKNHKHQLGLEILKSRETQQQLDVLQANFINLQLAYKEKEKELEIRNIYSHRITRPPHKLPTSYSSSPILNSSHTDDDKRYASAADLTPRFRAQEYANKLRSEDYRRKEKTKRKPKAPTDNKTEDVGLPPFPLRRNTNDRNTLDEMENDRLIRAGSKQREEEARRLEVKRQEEMREDEEKVKRSREYEEQKRQAAEWEAKMVEVKRHREDQERLARDVEVKEKRRRDDEVKRLEEDRKGMEREKMEEKQLEEERLAAERELMEERRKHDSDPQMKEARKQKDLLLAKMRMIDRDEMEDPIEDAPPSSTSPASKKNYHFTSVTQNLHHGRPSHDYNSIPYLEKRKDSNGSYGSRRKDSDGFFDDEVENEGEFMPTFDFTSSKGKKHIATMGKTDKSKLLEDLFGNDSAVNKSEQNGYVPSIVARKEPPATKNSFLWGEDFNASNQHSKGNTSVGPRETSTLVAGGNMVLDLEEDSLLSRRYKHKPNTLQATPAMMAVDHFDDDIEEVIL